MGAHHRRLWRIAASMGVVACVSFACSLVRDLDELESRPPSAPDGASPPDGSASDGGDAGRCPPEMVEERFPDGTRFCIDRTEVTQAAYTQFLAEDAGTPPEGCTENKSYRPDEVRDGAPCEDAFDPVANGAMPVVCVDHCDATAYCSWRGARLCGAKGGARLTAADVDNPNVDEWFVACAGDDARAFAPGSTPSGCDLGGDGAVAASSDGCNTPEGVKHLSGNVAEWTNACSETACLTRGSNFTESEVDLFRCAYGDRDAATRRPRLTRARVLGFRCCKSL